VLVVAGTLCATMNESNARPSGRRRGSRRGGRRRDQSNTPPRSHRDDGPERSGNLTTTAMLPPVDPPTGFAELGVPSRIDDGVAACGFAKPFAIQTEAVPVAMQGRDVCGRAKTGSGKTLAFGLPMLARITDRAEPRKPLGLVLVPTRELAVQVAEVLEPIAQHAGMRVLPVYGGASRHSQIDALKVGAEMVVATPLRLIDLIKSGEVELSDVQIVCLDEADRMVGTMHHLFLAVHHMDKDKVIGAIGHGIPKLAVFCQTKRVCDKVARSLQDLGVEAAAIHGDLPQKARERALQRFAEGKLKVLVATDVAARGIDIDDIGAVIHYEPAKDVKDYLHRSGRTARAGRDGWAITLVEYNQHTQVRILQRGMRLPNQPAIEVFSNNPNLHDLEKLGADTTT
jgi:superfamily II DNA/RNA helicase